MARIDPGIPLKVSTLEQFRSDAVALPRFRTLLLIVFAVVAGALASVGVYGVMSYVAAQRQTEMGVRVALGATSGDVVAMLVGNGAKMAAIGLSCGLAMAIAAGRLIASMLYGIRPQDPLAVGGAEERNAEQQRTHSRQTHSRQNHHHAGMGVPARNRSC
jgi:ABC-type antimicrobial peptide transport system permease subunit